jgi:hypothetical protein
MVQFSNFVFPASVFTATGQTSTTIDLSPNQAGANGAYSAGALSVVGTGLTTATFQVLGSSDGGQNFFALNVAPATSPTSTSTMTTVTGNGLYYVDLAAITHIQIATSGTFTATSLSIQLTGSPNGSVVENSGGGGGGVTSFNGRTGAVVPAANDYSFSLLSGNLGTGQGPTSLTGIVYDTAGTLSVTTAGQLESGFGTQTANTVLSGPASGSAATPTFRALVSADLPSGIGTVTSFSAGALSPLFTSSVATSTTTPALTFTLDNAAQNSVLAGPATGGTGAPSYRALVAADLPAGTGTVTSVGLSSPGILYSVTGSPVTGSGTLALNLISQTANTFLAAPNGSAGNPSFRAIVAADLPAGTGTVTSVGLSAPGAIYTVTGSPVTGSGTLALSLISQTANTVFAAPNGSAGTPSFRALVTADLPAAPSVSSALTLNNSNSGAASGTTFNGSAAVTASANTFGAGSLANANTWSALNTFSNPPGTASGAYGTLFSGTPETSSLYNPVVYIYSTGTNPSFNPAGTILAINSPIGMSGYLLALYANGTLAGSVATSGAAFFSSASIGATAQFAFGSRANFSSPSTGLIDVGTGTTAGIGGSLAMTNVNLGASGTLGTAVFGNATSGTVTLEAVTGALGTVTAQLPANSGTIAELNLAQTWTAAQTISGSSGTLLDITTSSVATTYTLVTMLSPNLGAGNTVGWVLGLNTSVANDGVNFNFTGNTNPINNVWTIGFYGGALNVTGYTSGGVAFGNLPSDPGLNNIQVDGFVKVGVSGTAIGGVIFNNATSGTITLESVTGALGTVTAQLPANSGIIAELNLAQTWTAAQTFSTSISSPIMLNTATQTSVAGSTSGTAVFSEPQQGSSWKRIEIVLTALTGTASYTFPVAFVKTPDSFVGFTATGATASSISTTAVTITSAASGASASSGTIILEGY